MSQKVLETNNYNLFVLGVFQRPLRNNKKLEASMQKDGFWDDEPIKVERENGKLVITAGQHRFHYARKLGLPIKYFIVKRKVNIPGDEGTKKNWTLHDYLFSHCLQEKEAYLRVKEYYERTGIGLQSCISMLAGDSAGSGNWAQQFKDGTYKLGNPSHSIVVATIIAQCRESGFPYWNHSMFVSAVSKIAWAKGFASEVLKEKIKTFAHFMTKQASVQNYVEMLESIYNRQSREKIPLAFLAEEAAKKRNAIKAGK